MQLSGVKKISTILEINGSTIEAVDIVTMRGLETIASCLGSASEFDLSWMPYLALGQGEKSPSTEDRYLENELYRQQATITNSENVYTARTVFTNFTAAFILREVGLLDESQGGVLGARWSLTNDLNVAMADSVDLSCMIYIT